MLFDDVCFVRTQTEVEKINSTEMKEYLSQLLANEWLFGDLQV